ncbi:unnamed protein product [Cyprideis torosa]|uniref:ABC transporter domain-containing protein n=1 Tax=Cyprideis torosa TaxID=163714 RepID=A0A7R8WMT9_9CRUS|nr:unnamed protein product [Cyprideis torosa]CAG0904034.1 unnamed protein product [Cyprideis torosa]
MNLTKGDKVVLLSRSSRAATAFYEIVTGNAEPDSGDYKWGVTTTQAYLPIENSEYFNNNLTLVDWLRQYAKTEEEREEVNIRGFLGKMLFSGDEALKESNVLSGGEKMRCMFSRMMLQKANVLCFNEPTNHLDLESITALNNSMAQFKGTILLSSHDHAMIQSVCNRILELSPNGIIDRYMDYDEYLLDEKVKALRQKLYA